MKRVVIVQTVAKQYRKPFFEALHKRLLSHDIDLQVIYSAPAPKERSKSDHIKLERSYAKQVPITRFPGGKLDYQWSFFRALRSDLVIVEQANKHVLNLMLIALSKIKLSKFAYWGHGLNLQGDSSSRSERLKRKLATLADWWFAYTSKTTDYLHSLGYPPERTTNIQNSVDISTFRSELEALSPELKDSYKARYGIPLSSRIGIFCASLYAEKRLDLLLEALPEIWNKHPDFHCLIAGGGQQQDIAQQFCQRYPNAHYLGPIFGRDKALAFACADLYLHPGVMGLGILDAFAASLPVLCCTVAGHGPEIAYLKPGYNGHLCEDNARSFSALVCTLLGDHDQLGGLQQHAHTSANDYSIENMAERFAKGIIQALHEDGHKTETVQA